MELILWSYELILWVTGHVFLGEHRDMCIPKHFVDLMRKKINFGNSCQINFKRYCRYHAVFKVLYVYSLMATKIFTFTFSRNFPKTNCQNGNFPQTNWEYL